MIAMKRVRLGTLGNWNALRGKADCLVLSIPGHIARNQLDSLYGCFEVAEVGWDDRIRPLELTRGLVFLQPSFRWEDDVVIRKIDELKSAFAGSKQAPTYVILDAEAGTQIRFAAVAEEHCDIYIKKQLLRNPSLYREGVFGDTNLMDYLHRTGRANFPRREGIHWDAIKGKMRIGWNFAHSNFARRLLKKGHWRNQERPVQIHWRGAGAGSNWCAPFRTDVLSILEREGWTFPTGVIKHEEYMEELSRSRICLSPFGFGEICWRDVEAMACGAVVLKGDMSHLETWPPIYQEWKTYVPYSWDLSDFSQNLARVLEDHDLRRSIAENARQDMEAYLRVEVPPVLQAPPFAPRPELR